MKLMNYSKIVRITLICGFILIILVFSACSNQDDMVETGKADKQGYKVSLNVEIDAHSSISPKYSMTRVAVDEDISKGLKTTWNDNDKLTVAYTSNGTMKTAELTVKSKEGNSATFTGQVETSQDAEAFNHSTLYAVNKTSKITTKVDANKLKVEVDLEGQKGTAAGIAEYDLLYAKGNAGSTLCFTHQMCVMRLDFQTDGTKLGRQLSEVSFSFVPITSTQSSVFAETVSFEFGENEKTNSYKGNTFLTLSDIYTSGNKVYAVLPPHQINDKLTGELSIKVKDNKGVAYRKNIKLKNKLFAAQMVEVKSIKLREPAERVPVIGDYLYSDGTWGPLEYSKYGEYPVAIIFSNYTSLADRQKGFVHGYAMALRDAAWPTAWGPDYNDYQEAPNLFENI